MNGWEKEVTKLGNWKSNNCALLTYFAAEA
jgi:hypothetical protein